MHNIFETRFFFFSLSGIKIVLRKFRETINVIKNGINMVEESLSSLPKKNRARCLVHPWIDPKDSKGDQNSSSDCIKNKKRSRKDLNQSTKKGDVV